MARRRRRGEGTVYFDGVSWIARYPLGVVNGKRRSKRVRAKTEREAKAELQRLKDTYSAGGDPAAGTLSEYLEGWLRSHGRGVRSSTRTSYEGHVRLHIDPLLGGIPLARLRAKDVDRLIDELQRKGLKPGTIIRIVTTLRIALNAAVKRRVIPYNEAESVVLPDYEPEPVRALTSAEADAILDAVRGHWVERIVRLLLGSGMRLGEAIGLDQGDAVLDGLFVRVRVTKTRVRAIGITEDAADAIRESIADAPRRGPNEPIFFGPRTGDRLRGDSVTHVLPRLLERAGIGHLTPHGLRHGAATLMLTAGFDLKTIASQLGHRSPNITTRYAHVVPERERAALAALERKRAT